MGSGDQKSPLLGVDERVCGSRRDENGSVTRVLDLGEGRNPPDDTHFLVGGTWGRGCGLNGRRMVLGGCPQRGQQWGGSFTTHRETRDGKDESE